MTRFQVPLVAFAALGLLIFSAGSRAAVPDLKPGDGPEAFDQVKFWTAHQLLAGEYGLVDEAIAEYADLNLSLNGPMSDIVRGCGRNDDAKVITSFGAYMTQRSLIDEMEKKEKPEEPWAHARPFETLRKVDAKSAKAICDGMGFSTPK